MLFHGLLVLKSFKISLKSIFLAYRKKKFWLSHATASCVLSVNFGCASLVEFGFSACPLADPDVLFVCPVLHQLCDYLCIIYT